MYAIVKTGGKQYRVEQGQSLLVERLPAAEGESVDLQPLLVVDGSSVLDQVDGLSGATVAARIVAHERGPKLRVVKFKPKRGYKRRNGHRQELTRIEVTEISAGSGSPKRSRSRKAASKEEPAAASEAAATPAATAEAAPAPAAVPEAAETASDAPVTPATTTNPEDSDGA
jgi:large subunit ribosomal protein L21